MGIFVVFDVVEVLPVAAVNIHALIVRTEEGFVLLVQHPPFVAVIHHQDESVGHVIEIRVDAGNDFLSRFVAQPEKVIIRSAGDYLSNAGSVDFLLRGKQFDIVIDGRNQSASVFIQQGNELLLGFLVSNYLSEVPGGGNPLRRNSAEGGFIRNGGGLNSIAALFR